MEDLGKNRALAAFPRLSALNPYVKVRVQETPLSEQDITPTTV